MGITLDVRYNRMPQIRARFPREVNRIVREQVLVTEADVKTNIAVKYGAVDTGAMLNSTTGRMTGDAEGEVTVSAQSAQGYPYPVAVNYGTRFMPGRPFMNDAAAKAESEFPARFRELEALL